MNSPLPKADTARPAPHTQDALAAQIKALAAEGCDIRKLREGLIAVCLDKEASWMAVSLLDQYQRRGMLDERSAKDLKRYISRLALGLPGVEEKDDDLEPAQPANIERGAAKTSDPPASAPAAPQVIPTVMTTVTPMDAAAHARTARTEPPVQKAEPPRPTALPPRREPAPDHAAANAEAQPRRQEPPRHQERPSRQEQPPPEAPAVGDTLHSRYVLEELLWKHDRIFFFRAMDVDRRVTTASECHVGLKVLHLPGPPDSPQLQTMQQEFRQMHALVHPGIPRVYAMEHDGDKHFLVMELLSGFTLSELLAQAEPRILSRKHARALIGSIGSALAYAHEHGVVHGELRFEDIVITASGEVKLQAFATSRVGTWDEHSDILSLAALAYELLSGRHPFDGLPPAEARSRRRRPAWTPALSGSEWRALRHALQWERQKRTASVREFLQEMGCASAPAAVTAPAQLVGAAVARPRVASLAGVAAAICMLAVGIGAFLVTKKDMEPASLNASTASTSESAPQQQEDPTLPAAPVSAAATSVPVAAASDRGGVAGQSPLSQQFSSAASAPASPQSAPINKRPGNIAARAEPQQSKPPNAAAANSESAAVNLRQDRNRPVAAEPRKAQTDYAPSVAKDAGVLSFAQDMYSVAPSDGIARLVLKRRGPSLGPVSFKWWTVPGSASPEKDFVQVKPRVERMVEGQEQITLAVPVVVDTARKKNQYFEVHIGSPEGARLGTYTTAAVILVGRG